MLAFSESFARLDQVLKPGSPLLLKVRVQIEEAGTRLSLQEARRLEGLPECLTANEFRVRLQLRTVTEDTLDGLEDALSGSPGNCQVVFELCAPDGSVAVLQAQQHVKVTAGLVEAVRELCGDQAIQMAAGEE
jgi:DNA polymerase III alpha subunit